MKKSPVHTVFCLAMLTVILSAAGCGFRPAAAGNASVLPLPVSVSATPEPSPTAIPEFRVEYRCGDAVLGSESVPAGGHPAAVPQAAEDRLLGWTAQSGEEIRPEDAQIRSDTVFYALTGPALNHGADYLFCDANGLLTPESTFTKSDAAAALRALMADSGQAASLLADYDADPEAAMDQEGFRSMLETLFLPRRAQETMALLPESDGGLVTRAQAAWCLATLLEEAPQNDRYFPDVSPSHWAYEQLTSAAAPGTLESDALLHMTLDDFLWFDGYLYRLDEEGYFITDETVDDLYYDKNGRYTSGNAELDGYVAGTLTELMKPDKTRLEHLRAVYLHVKNDFRYLVRNYYASGESGWAIKEALTMYETGKGNCYNYTGVFWSLARGLGYNAVTWSGTMGTQNQPHSWTEILYDGQIYICDPEIELNYWLLEIYTDNFWMKKENSYGWNYQAVGRS